MWGLVEVCLVSSLVWTGPENKEGRSCVGMGKQGYYLHVVFILHLAFAIPLICNHS